VSLNERAGASWPPSLGQPATRSADGGLGAAVFAGSQVGSQRQQTSGDTQPQLAAIAAAKQPVRPQPAPSRDGQSVPSKQRVAGSNPARRAGQRHITILSLNDGSPTGSQRERDGRCSGTSSARGAEAGLPRCQRHVASVITARRPAVLLFGALWDRSWFDCHHAPNRMICTMTSLARFRRVFAIHAPCVDADHPAPA